VHTPYVHLLQLEHLQLRLDDAWTVVSSAVEEKKVTGDDIAALLDFHG
jgi:hypothetical protein